MAGRRRAPARTRSTTLERAGLVDDARVAATRAESLAERGFGDAAIRYDLEREGIAGDLIEEALGGLEPEPERARALMERRGDGGRRAAGSQPRASTPQRSRTCSADLRTTSDRARI